MAATVEADSSPLASASVSVSVSVSTLASTRPSRWSSYSLRNRSPLLLVLLYFCTKQQGFPHSVRRPHASASLNIFRTTSRIGFARQGVSRCL